MGFRLIESIWISEKFSSTQLYKAFSLVDSFILADQVWRYNCFHWKQLLRQTWLAKANVLSNENALYNWVQVIFWLKRAFCLLEKAIVSVNKVLTWKSKCQSICILMTIRSHVHLVWTWSLYRLTKPDQAFNRLLTVKLVRKYCHRFCHLSFRIYYGIWWNKPD